MKGNIRVGHVAGKREIRNSYENLVEIFEENISLLMLRSSTHSETPDL
jgi:hypothetical protein